MLKKLLFLIGILLISLSNAPLFAQADDQPLGQTIQIYTQFRYFTGKPSWLLVIRDLDHNENIPYLFDIYQGTNFWVAFTYSRNYLITISNLQFSPYGRPYSQLRPYKTRRINNFCNLESRGRIIRGKSIYITIKGDLTPYQTFKCYVSKYPDSNFTIVPRAEEGD
ncbi:MAG: hypothetical protein A3F12_08065 [Gammaproteobacteria bacterium RIFCSPHIGHO2_12_FULL_38_14]|nr:MAG: hypothetical protein A3F12_08065 [Gammaproteobacteria bacterium RIFCSPHIGHO2_12_FULL_38_14]